MSIFRKILAIAFAILFLNSFSAQLAIASDFAQAYLRLDRTKANTALSGLVCAKPSSAGAGTEAKVLVRFPSDFTISTTISNWTTSTSGIPSDGTAWPGIGSSATSVSSNIVTFASSDLTSSSNLYCFEFTGNSSTTGDSGAKNGTITTKSSGNTTIDSSDYGLTIVDNDQITVSATVPASSSDYSVSLSQVTSSTLFAQSKEIEYQITYGTSLSYPTAITLEADWSQGTIAGESTPSVDVLDYVTGSAGDAYGSASPVIDTVNRTITWTISSFPGGTSGQTVSFKLKTTSNYTGSSKVNFTTSALINFPGGETTPSDSSADYQYVATSSTSSGPTSTPTPGPGPTPTPSAPVIQSIDIREISKDSATIYVQTDKATTKVIKYGTSTSNLDFSVSSSQSVANLITLSNLDSDTKYFFKVYATDMSGKQAVSDFYTFTTASSALAVEIDITTLVAASNQTILSLLPKLTEKEQIKNPVLIIPRDTPFQFRFSLKNHASVKKVQAIVRKKVLGVNTFIKIVEASTEVIDLIEVEPGVYSGTLKTRPEPGDYDIFAKIYDTSGNIAEQKIADLKVVNKFTVLSKSKLPVEGARALIYIYNQTTKLYQIIPSSNLSTGNPAFTDSKGEIDLVLPYGKYKAAISDINYKDKTVEFEIGIKNGQEYPIIILESSGVSPLQLIKYYLKTINEVFLYYTQFYALALTGSTRFFDLLAALILGALALITLFAFSKKHHIPFSGMVSYFYYLLDHKNNHANYIHGVVYDEKNQPVPRVNVYLNNKDSEKISAHSQTDRNGEFFFKASSKGKYLIMCMAKGYRTTPLLRYAEKKHLKFKIIMEKEHEGVNLLENISHLVFFTLGMFFEALLLVSIVLELLFLNSFGIIRAAPFLAISIFNLFLWMLYIRHRHIAEE
ncbi:MAG: carboxypeptidase regulatory-like domain-containing protein [Patescibacteria group bacterium]